MSGGVDSSVAALLMKEAGYDCLGVTMKLNENTVNACGEKTCCTASDAEDARGVCVKLGIPYYVYNFAEDFRRCVIDNFVHSYEIGETPNPCIECNRCLKFGRLFHRAKELECDVIVTGHYARIEFDEKSGRYLLKKALNAAKDQSYVLYFMSQEQLAHTRFPLGGFADKTEIRAIAEAHGLVNAKKAESQDICFVPDGDYAGFITEYSGKVYPEGEFTDREGNVLGRHKGIIHYTVGQRKGLGISFSEPLYVIGKDAGKNSVRLGTSEQLFSDRLTARDFNWISLAEPPEKPIRVTVRTRYHAKEAPASVCANPDGTVEIIFDEPQRAISPGQAAVLYDGDVVVGGGTIC